MPHHFLARKQHRLGGIDTPPPVPRAVAG